MSGPSFPKEATPENDWVMRLASVLNANAKQAILMTAEKDERIAELEAELADADAQYDMCMRRAEKAEAEVERLSRHDSAATAMLAILATPEQWAEFQRVARGVNPSGDTLGGGGRESVREGNAGRDRASPGAAEPDACCDDYPYCGHDMVRQPDGSWKHVLPARKERDEG